MVKYFSVDWLAQSHHDRADTPDSSDSEDATNEATSRPHVPCVVPPAPPKFGKSCLQPKQSKPSEHKEVGEEQEEPGSCPSSPDSKSSDYTSGDDGKPESPQEGSSGDGVEGEKRRRVRTKFSTEQLARLEKIFSKHKYLDVVRRVKTAQKLDLSETQVRTWFQNRRMKMKREMHDHTISPETFQHLVPLQYGAMAPQPPQYPTYDPAFYYPYNHLPPQPQMAPHLIAPYPHYFTGLLYEN